MRRKLLTLALGIAAMFTGCQKEDSAGLTNPDNGKATFHVAVDNGVQTRAATPADAPTRYIMEVYTVATQDAAVSGKCQQHLEAATGFFEVSLKEGTHYVCLFWADYGTPRGSSNEYYASDLKFVRPKNGLATSMAFGGSVRFTYDSQETDKSYLTPTLTHSVAQVNFKQTEDFTAAGNTLTVTFPKGFTLNLDGNKAMENIGSTGFSYTFTDIAKESENTTIGTGYIIAPDAGQTVMDITTTFNSEVTKTITNIPFQRNHKTNITGAYSNLYETALSVTCDDAWETPENEKNLDARIWDGTYPTTDDEAKEWMGEPTAQTPTTYTITTAKQLAGMAYYCSQAIRDETFELSTDIDLANYPWRPIGVSGTFTFGFKGTFNGNGHTIKRMNITPESAHICNGFMAICTGTVKNLIVEGKVVGSGSRNNTELIFAGIVGSTRGVYSKGNIIACGFRGTIDCNITTNKSIYVGGIAGTNEGGNIAACISWATSVTATGGNGNYSGSIAGFLKKNETEATAKGNYWYYNNSEGIQQNFGGTSDTPVTADNASFLNNTAINAAISTINSYLTGNDYIWQANSDPTGYPTLVKRQ